MQVLKATMTWKQCTDLPTDMAEGQSIVINNTVYIGGKAAATADEFLVYSYDPSRDKWGTLPPLPVKYFGLGEVKGELVAVGGMRKGADTPTSEVYVYDMVVDRWKQTMSPMPTARAFPSVASLKSRSVSVVAGGLVELYDDEYTSVVEIYRTETSRWSRVDSLPVSLHYISMLSLGNMCYILGENTHTDDKQRGFYTSIESLIASAASTVATGAQHDAGESRSCWKNLPGALSYQPSAGALGSHLLAIGGWTDPEAKARKNEVYVFSPSMNCWSYIVDLPAPRACSTIAVLTRTEVLIVGGYGGDDNKVNTVYKGTLNLKV